MSGPAEEPGAASAERGGLTARLGAVDLGGQKVRFQLLFFTQFIAFSGFVVFRNVYLDEMGMSGSAMGAIGFLMMATGVLAQPVWGLITDYWRVERLVLGVGAVVSGLALLSYPVGSGLESPFLVVALGTAVFSAFRAPIVPIANGMILSRGYDYGNIRAFGSIAFGIGSLGFGFLVAALGTASIVYFYVAGMAVLVLVVWSMSDPPSETDDDGDDELPLGQAIRRLVTSPTFLVVLGVAFLIRLSTSGGAAFFSVYVRAVDAGLVLGPVTLAPDALTGIAWALKTVFEAIAFVYAIRLGVSYRWLLLAGGVGVAVTNLVYGLTASPWAILAAQAAGGIGYALFSLAAINLVHAVATESVKSTAQTALSGVGLGLGAAVGQIVAGGLMELVGIQRMYVIIAAIGVVGALGGLLVGHDGRLDGSQHTG